MATFGMKQVFSFESFDVFIYFRNECSNPIGRRRRSEEEVDAADNQSPRDRRQQADPVLRHRGDGRRRHHRTRAARLLRGLPPSERPPRQDLLPRHAPPPTAQAALRARPLRIRPLRGRLYHFGKVYSRGGTGTKEHYSLPCH